MKNWKLRCHKTAKFSLISKVRDQVDRLGYSLFNHGVKRLLEEEMKRRQQEKLKEERGREEAETAETGGRKEKQKMD